MKKLWKFFTSRVFITSFMLFLECCIIISVLIWIGSGYYVYAVLLYAFSGIMTLAVINRNYNPAYKIAWITFILFIPLVGGVLYLIFGKHRTTRQMANDLKNIEKDNILCLPQNQELVLKIEKENPHYGRQVRSILSSTNHPVFINTQTVFLSPGEEKFRQMLIDLQNAEKFIFLEYFIIAPGKMWDEILKILLEKASKGVDVRLIYDDFGTITTLPNGYDKALSQAGIKTCVFNPYKARLNAFMNNRDHRKILIIDGNIGYTGGINLADEYINQKERYGHWKDASILLKGEAVFSLTVLFLQNWRYITGEISVYNDYRSTQKYSSDGYVMPFGDNPIVEERVAESAYLQIIHSAVNYVYIETPYLIMDNELTTALILAARSGVDVKIVVPHIPDKFYVHALTSASYPELISNGVKIYEYTPGFIHSKIIIADDNVGMIGTVNLDFRSLYLHFECSVWLYKTFSLVQIKDDFLNILSTSKQITQIDCDNVKWYKRLLSAVLKPFAPLM